MNRYMSGWWLLDVLSLKRLEVIMIIYNESGAILRDSCQLLRKESQQASDMMLFWHVAVNMHRLSQLVVSNSWAN